MTEHQEELAARDFAAICRRVPDKTLLEMDAALTELIDEHHPAGDKLRRQAGIVRAERAYRIAGAKPVAGPNLRDFDPSTSQVCQLVDRWDGRDANDQEQWRN